MRRIVFAALGTVSTLVLIFAYPTSHNASVTGDATAVAVDDPAAADDGTGTDDGTDASATSDDASPSAEATSEDSDDSSDPAASSTGTAASSTTASRAPAAAKTTQKTAKSYTGHAVDTQWGVVQVRITVKNGRIVASQAIQHPSGNGHNDRINAYAVPILNAEVVSAQSAHIDSVSGATVTSDGYVASLQSALDAAHL